MSKLKTIDIKGKPYVQVHERIKAFRSIPGFERYRIDTEIYHLADGEVIVKAFIYNPSGEVVSSGHAYELKDSSFINKTSHIENAETSAVGRALGFLGIGVDDDIASIEEVVNASNITIKSKAKTQNIHNG